MITVSNGYEFHTSTFINIYSKENPILNDGDPCYFLVHPIDVLHRPLICKGVIISAKYNDGLNKHYTCKVTEFCETENNLNKWVYNKNFYMYPGGLGKAPKIIKVTKNSDENFFNENLFKVEAFFMRETVENIVELRKDYIKVILADYKNSIIDMEEILNS